MYYTVKQVSEIFQVNPETVRRWVRTEKLKAVKSKSRKEGFLIEENSLEEFKRQHGKYQISNEFDSTDLSKVVARINEIKIHITKINELMIEIDEFLECL